jgi:hypothetical protein
MSFGTKYRCEFYDLGGLDWKVDFEWSGYDPGSGITEMQASGNPLTIEPLADADDLHESPIHGTKADLRVMATSSFQYDPFYVLGDTEVRTSIYRNGSLYFRGYVLPSSLSEPYNDTPYEVTISSADGLGYLRQVKYDDDGAPYEGRMRESQVILDILAKIGFSTFTEIINIYEENMADGTGDSPIDQTLFDVSVLEDMYCYEALEYMLSKWDAIIRQKNGVFYIFRPTELKGTAYYRIFTAATVKTSGSFNPAISISRSGTPSDVRDTNGGVKMLINPVKKLTIRHDLGWKESWIKNWEFKGETFDGTDFAHWAQAASTNAVEVESVVPGEFNGVYLNSFSVAYAYYIEQVFSPQAAPSVTDGFYLELDFLFFNGTAALIASTSFYVLLAVGSSTYKYFEVISEDAGAWSDSVQRNAITADAPVGSSGWINWKRKITGVDIGSQYTIIIYSSNKTGARVAVRNVRWTASSVQITTMSSVITDTGMRRIRTSTLSNTGFTRPKKIYTFRNTLEKIYTPITNAINGDELDLDYILGDVLAADAGIDNILEQFAGALSVSMGSLTDVATKFVNDYATFYHDTHDVLLTSSGPDLIFEAHTAGTPFTGLTSITNTSGNLTAAAGVVHTQLNSTGTDRIDTVTLNTNATCGSVSITCESVTKSVTFVTSPTATAAKFVTDWAASYAAAGVDVTVTSVNNIIYFTPDVSGNDFVEDDLACTHSNVLMGGTVADHYTNNTPGVTALKHIDKITLSGSSGSADIVVGGVSQEAVFSNTLTETAHNFISDGDVVAAYAAADIDIDHDGATIIFSAQVAGTDSITGTTSITPIGAALNGTAYSPSTAYVAEVPEHPAVARVDKIVIAGTSGHGHIRCENVTCQIDFDYSLAATAANFAADFYADYEAVGILLSSSGSTIYFTSATPGTDNFYYDHTALINPSGITGTTTAEYVANEAYIAPEAAVKRIDRITISGSGGSAVIDIENQEQTMAFDSTVTHTIDNFVTDFGESYELGGYGGVSVILSRSGNDLVITGKFNEDFNYGSSITGATLLNGSIQHYQSNRVAVTAVARVDRVTITPTANTGTASVNCEGVTRTITYVSGVNAACTQFVTDHAADFLVDGGVDVTSSTNILIFTAHIAGTDFHHNDTGVVSTGVVLSGTISSPATPLAVTQAQIDTITLTGSNGSANIVCDEGLGVASFNPIPTSAWNTRGGAENDPLLELVGGELGYQFSRPRQMLQIPLQDTINADTGTHVDVLGCYTDSTNLVGGNPRKFVMNRGVFDVKNRRWDADLIEIIE